MLNISIHDIKESISAHFRCNISENLFFNSQNNLTSENELTKNSRFVFNDSIVIINYKESTLIICNYKNSLANIVEFELNETQSLRSHEIYFKVLISVPINESSECSLQNFKSKQKPLFSNCIEFTKNTMNDDNSFTNFEIKVDFQGLQTNESITYIDEINEKLNYPEIILAVYKSLCNSKINPDCNHTASSSFHVRISSAIESKQNKSNATNHGKIILEACDNNDVDLNINVDLSLYSNGSFYVMASNESRVKLLIHIEIPAWEGDQENNFSVYIRKFIGGNYYDEFNSTIKLSGNGKNSTEKVKSLSKNFINDLSNKNLTCQLINIYLEEQTTATKKVEFYLKSLNENYNPLESISRHQNESAAKYDHRIPLLYVKYNDPLILKMRLKDSQNKLVIFNSKESFYFILDNFKDEFYQIKQINESNVANCVELRAELKRDMFKFFRFVKTQKTFSDPSRLLSDFFNKTNFSSFCEAVYNDTKVVFNNKSINQEFLFDILIMMPNQIVFTTIRLVAIKLFSFFFQTI